MKDDVRASDLQRRIAMDKVRVIVLVVCCAILYGVLHDQLTIRVSQEYFTLAHPAPPVPLPPPTLLGLYWGVAGTVGVGLLLGVLLAQASQSGDAPPKPIAALSRSVFRVMAGCFTAAIVAGSLAYVLAVRGIVHAPDPWSSLLPQESQVRFVTVLAAHCAGYAAGFVGGATLIFRIWLERAKPVLFTILPHGRYAVARTIVAVTLIVLLICTQFRG